MEHIRHEPVVTLGDVSTAEARLMAQPFVHIGVGCDEVTQPKSSPELKSRHLLVRLMRWESSSVIFVLLVSKAATLPM